MSRVIDPDPLVELSLTDEERDVYEQIDEYYKGEFLAVLCVDGLNEAVTYVARQKERERQLLMSTVEDWAQFINSESTEAQ